ncbi:DUF6048 family protein [Lacinutrix undariae]
MLAPLASFSQEETSETTESDTLVYKQKYGLRVGADISKLVRSFLDDDYSGFELNADYRLTHQWYLAGEIGNEEKTTINDYLTTTAKGSYFKVGADYNMYQNWLDMQNMIYFGFRLGASTFSQNLDELTVYNSNPYWDNPISASNVSDSKGLTAIWGEIMIGIKAEVLNNLYMGLNVQLKGLVSQTEPGSFENLYIPGFGRTYDSGGFGMGFGYNISYSIPIYKKDKKVIKEKDEDE